MTARATPIPGRLAWSADLPVVVVGATSLLGWTMLAAATSLGLSATPTCNRHNRALATQNWLRFNLDEPEAWGAVARLAPAMVIHCGGICHVERCQANPEFARAINVGGVRSMLAALSEGTQIVYCSSDHVFAGDTGPYLETTKPSPISVYGQTRVEAETEIANRRPDALIVRLGLPIGPSQCGRRGHLDWLRDRHRRGLAMTVIDGERRSAVWADVAGRRILELAEAGVSGIRHVCATRASARPELAAALCEHLGLAPGYRVSSRAALGGPHLGDVELGTIHRDPLAAPLVAVLDDLDAARRSSKSRARSSS